MRDFYSFSKWQIKLVRRISDFWDGLIARRALLLADEPRTVLDLSCGNGQFWSLLAAKRGRRILAADISSDRLVIAWNAHTTRIIERICLLHTPIFPIELPDGSVDCIFSMKPLQLPSDPHARMNFLREFHRVTRDSVIVSIDVERNIVVQPSKQSQSKVGKNAGIRALASVGKIEAEFRLVGFLIQQYIVRLPPLDLRRVYILRKVDLQPS